MKLLYFSWFYANSMTEQKLGKKFIRNLIFTKLTKPTASMQQVPIKGEMYEGKQYPTSCPIKGEMGEGK